MKLENLKKKNKKIVNRLKFTSFKIFIHIKLFLKN